MVPDAKRLAFSLFGTIWQVSPEGGAAEQLTSSAGYNAHPAWSPRGDRIAFVAGGNPQGRIPNISGELRIVDINTGKERPIKTVTRNSVNDVKENGQTHPAESAAREACPYLGSRVPPHGPHTAKLNLCGFASNTRHGVRPVGYLFLLALF